MRDARVSARPAGQRAILACDIVAFGARRGHVQRYLREQLYSRTRAALDSTGIPFDECYHEDRGDGLFLVPPPRSSVEGLVTSTVDRLEDEIRRQHDLARPGARLRLRVALDFGLILSDEYGVLGDTVIRAFRLLDAPLFKRRVQQSGARLSVILSDRLYEDVVRPDLGGPDPSDYERLRIRSKETRTRAWVRLLGVPPDRAPRSGVAFEDVSAVAAHLLGASPLDTAEGRDALVAALPFDLRAVILRQPDAMMDAYCILRPCVDDDRGRSALLYALGGLSLPHPAFDDLQEAISELP
ncbi:hypothetical protein E1287_00835 [Actinomadura sp. KC06]|uniref:hypothetical protein n=1 Tax=Actinomadura sp. KC06 TaxID=2530369 RepID=UPI00104CAC6F|nr:hypothetical protein [Actinomadura sp. KC06]TDD40550.1 hypothetical protein E1287_00835 [Actinomadura sp. KC06]